ncbi:hypothetical protein, partial [Lactobacillus delbrueckii]|uniref:hypothetical protein n=2 Tax=Lactobacillus delbrueckii TaxID=1584 RepID=UPI0021A25BEE
LTPNLTAFTGVDSQNLPDVMVSVQFILAIGVFFLVIFFLVIFSLTKRKRFACINLRTCLKNS